MLLELFTVLYFTSNCKKIQLQFFPQVFFWLTSASFWHVLVRESPRGILCLLRTPHGGFRSGIPQGGGRMVYLLYALYSYMLFLNHERLGQRIVGRCCIILSILMLPRKQVCCGFCLTLLLVGVVVMT